MRRFLFLDVENRLTKTVRKPQLCSKMANRKVLFIGLVWPEPTSSAAGTRIIQLVNSFLSQGDEVHFASAAAKSDYSFDLPKLGATEHSIELNSSSFNDFIKSLNPDVVVFDRFVIEEQFGWRVRQECPNTLTILDTEDLHFLRKARQGQDLDLYNEITKREIASILRCDLSLIISEFEMDLLKRTFKIDASLLYYLPFLEEEITAAIQETWVKFEDRKDFVFIGNYLHEPNWKTLLYLKNEIWPSLSKALPQAKLNIYGAYASEKVTQLHKPAERFLIHGRAENSRRTIALHRILLAPLQFGAGVKGKFIDAMQTGTPTITTTVGAEGMKGNLEWNGIIADAKEAITDACLKLYDDKESWAKAQENGIKIINNRYSKSKFESSFLTHVNQLTNQLSAHRQANYIGQVLNHQTLQSTKYLSLWIEEKNRK